MTETLENGIFNVVLINIVLRTIINKIIEKFKGLAHAIKGFNIRGLAKNPLFYFGLISLLLFGFISNSCASYSSFGPTGGKVVFLNSFLNNKTGDSRDNLFVSQDDKIALETPDLKLTQDNTLFGISTTSIVSAKVLGDAFGSVAGNKKDVTDYTVQPGDTLQSIADANNISVNTLLWANDMTSSSTLKVGQSLTLLPTNGVLRVVKSGDTIGAIALQYKAKSEDIIAFNNLANQDDIYVGDILLIPGGVMPKKVVPLYSNQVPLANNYFIFPVQGQISQGLHYYNAVDIRNKCGTPIYAAAAGVVQRAVANGGYNLGMGNHITILHSNGTVTYYGHLMALLVKPGDKVDVGQNIALMGGAPGMAGAGNSTGCHVHFQVQGASNPLARYAVGAYISYK